MADKEALSEADIDAMPLGKVYRALIDYGVNGDHLSPTEAITALKEKIRELTVEAEKARSPEQVAEMMASIAESYRTRRELLLQCCRDVIAYLPNLDQSDREMLTLRFRRDVMEILREVQEHLSKDDCPILVTGETSAGKSALLNLLLGDDILPVTLLSTTSTICELKYGETRKAVVHLREPDPETGSHRITLPLSADPEQCQQQLAPHIHLKAAQREALPPASKIEIFWPLSFLKGGVTIVDSPGVGESEMMDEVVARYIPLAFAFIYIIDSSRAGGVQQDRLGRLLAKCKDQGARSELEQFDPTKAIFVCNKWDLVPEREREEVKEETIRKLGEMWGGLDESQVFTYSNTEAVKGDFRSADFNKLLDGIYELLPQSLNHKLSVQYRRLTRILENALTLVKLKLNDVFSNLDAGERRRANAEALSRFAESTARTLKEARDFLEGKVDQAASTILTDLLHGDELKKHLSKVPIKAGTEKDALKELISETENYITSHQQFRNGVKTISQQFDRKFQAMVTTVGFDYDTNLRPVTGLLLFGPDDMMFHMQTIWFLGLLPFLAPLLLLVTIPFAALVGLKVWLFSKSYDERARSRLCDEAIIGIEKNSGLHSIVRNRLRWAFELLDEFESDLQAKKKLFQRLMEERVKETRSQIKLDRTYGPQASRITIQLGRLAMVQLGEMRQYDFDLDSIAGWQDPQNRIGGGSYGKVYRVQVQRNGALVEAALKVGAYPYDITTEDNAWDFLTEEDNLGKLQGEHIVEYYGTACRRVKTEGQPDRLRLGLVMELCEGTLEDRIIGQREHNPTWWGHDATMKQRAFSYTQNLAVQLCEGLRTIHDAGYIHRDLKLINVLVAPGEVVKLTDFGETKREVEVTGTISGTAKYAAPEVKERKVYNKSADIYSLGLILWEMWYGRTVEDDSLRALAEGESMTMPDSPDSVRPIPEWRTLVQDCVKRDASRRPTALDCLQRIRSMTMED